LGRLDVVVNSASVMIRQPFGTVTPQAWDDVLNVNLRAYFFVAQGAFAALKAAHGALINISDLSAIEAWPGYLPHSASKAGVDALTKGLARALAPEVRVNAIAPGAVLLPDEWGEQEAEEIVRTTPLRRLGSPADVVRAVEYLIEADYTTGTTLVVDGGRLLAPRTK
jgi:pteridine reductase